MCKEFNEVDKFAATLLLSILKNPSSAISQRLNPFNPVSVTENLNQSIYYIINSIQALNDKNNKKEQKEEDKDIEDDRSRKIEKRKSKQRDDERYWNRKRENQTKRD